MNENGDEATQELHFFYDNQPKITLMEYNGEKYRLVYNLQNDIVGVVDTTGNLVVEYLYDAWGNTVATIDSSNVGLQEILPFGYRGYEFDRETGLFFLRTRCYNAQYARFISADVGLGGNKGNAASNVFCYCNNAPINKVDSTGMRWNLIKSAVKGVISGVLHAINTIAVKVGIDTASHGAAVLDMEKDANNVYHAKFDCWQQHFGYNNFYDFMFDLGTSMEDREFPFSYNGQDYILWLWKGDYINLGAGAELGIYSGGYPHWKVDKKLAMSMSMSLSYKGKDIITWSDKTWWITGFNPAYLNVKASDLMASFSVTFNSRDMYEAFVFADHDGWIYDDARDTATYVF